MKGASIVRFYSKVKIDFVSITIGQVNLHDESETHIDTHKLRKQEIPSIFFVQVLM